MGLPCPKVQTSCDVIFHFFSKTCGPIWSILGIKSHSSNVWQFRKAWERLFLQKSHVICSDCIFPFVKLFESKKGPLYFIYFQLYVVKKAVKNYIFGGWGNARAGFWNMPKSVVYEPNRSPILLGKLISRRNYWKILPQFFTNKNLKCTIKRMYFEQNIYSFLLRLLSTECVRDLDKINIIHNGGLVLGSCQFLLLPQLPQKICLLQNCSKVGQK